MIRDANSNIKELYLEHKSTTLQFPYPFELGPVAGVNAQAVEESIKRLHSLTRPPDVIPRSPRMSPEGLPVNFCATFIAQIVQVPMVVSHKLFGSSCPTAFLAARIIPLFDLRASGSSPLGECS